MAHLDSRIHHRRAKALTVATLSVKGDRGRINTRLKARGSRQTRSRLHQTLATFRDFTCTLDDSCDCRACLSDIVTVNHLKRVAKLSGGLHLTQADVLGHLMRIGKHRVKKTESFEEWFSHFKRELPDTLAGRHALDHIMEILGHTIECNCFQTVWDSKRNIRSCSCDRLWRLKDRLDR